MGKSDETALGQPRTFLLRAAAAAWPLGAAGLGQSTSVPRSVPVHLTLTKIGREYGDLAFLRLGSVPTVMIAHPDVMRDAFDKEELSARRIMVAHSTMSAEPGLIYSGYDQRWRALDQFARQRLFSANNVDFLSRDVFGPVIDEAVESLGRAASAGDATPMNELLFSSVFDLIYRSLFGREETDEHHRMKDALREHLAWFEAASTAYAYKLVDVLPKLRFLFSGLLKKSRLRMEKRDDVLGHLVDGVKPRRGANASQSACLVDVMLDKEAAGDISRPVTLALCVDVLVNTSAIASTVGWFLLLTANRPEVQTGIHEELDRVVGRDGPPPIEEDRFRLPYTFACLAESMRYRSVSPVSLPHLATADTRIAGYRIPAGTQVLGNIHSVHHDQRFWKSPDEFIPKRFLPRADGSPSRAMSSPAYMPFGVGIRRCAGDDFSMSAIWLYVARMLHRFRLESPHGVRLSEDELLGLFVSPEPYNLRATPRGSPPRSRKERNTVTEFLVRASTRRPWLVIGCWALLMIIGGLLAIDGELVPGIEATDILDPATTTEVKRGGGVESTEAERLLEEKLRGPERMTETLIVQSDSHTVGAPEFRAAVDEVISEIVSGEGGVARPGPGVMLSADRRTVAIPLSMTGSYQEAVENVDQILEIVRQADGRDGFSVQVVGEASIAREHNELAERDLLQGERVGVPIALVILLLLFGAVVAAITPIGLSLVAIAAALGMTALVGQIWEFNVFVALMIVMIGLAVGIDYSILVISRFREERERGLSVQQAIERAGSTAGRTVLSSGITVVISLCGMLLVPISLMQSLGFGAIIVVLVTLAATSTFLPAILAILGRHLDKWAVPNFRKRADRPSESGEGSGRGVRETMTRTVMRRPGIAAFLVAAPMIVAALFFFQWPGINTGINSVATLPEGAETRQAFLTIEEELSFGLATPTDVVVLGDVNSPEIREAMSKLRESIAAHPEMQVWPAIDVTRAGDLAHMTVFVQGDPGRRETVAVVKAIREQYAPAAFEGVSAEVLVGGGIAEIADVLDIVETYTPIVFVFVLGCSFLLLMLVFRSIVIPIKAVLMNLLSVGTTYGLIVLVFQHGIGADLLGLRQVESIEVWLPLFLFSVLFGLSMDYHIFLLSNIRERYDLTGDNAEAVAHGLRSTAGMITGAALIMVAVFGAFASGETTVIQQMGFGLAVAVLLDATLVRIVLVPASMQLLGKRNWYLPSWLRWLPELRAEAKS